MRQQPAGGGTVPPARPAVWWALWVLFATAWTAGLLSGAPIEVRNEVMAEQFHVTVGKSLHLAAYAIFVAAFVNRDLPRGAKPATPLFDLADVDATVRQLATVPYDVERELFPGITVRVREAGHIIGSSSIELCLTEQSLRRKLVFSGDLGQYDTPILHDPHRFETADLVIMESTYGDRRHRDRQNTEHELADIIAQAARDGGNIIVPAFAIGRSQEFLYLLARHFAEWHIARWKIFLDSPMAIAASRVYWQHPDRFDDEASRLRASSNSIAGSRSAASRPTSTSVCAAAPDLMPPCATLACRASSQRTPPCITRSCSSRSTKRCTPPSRIERKVHRSPTRRRSGNSSAVWLSTS